MQNDISGRKRNWRITVAGALLFLLVAVFQNCGSALPVNFVSTASALNEPSVLPGNQPTPLPSASPSLNYQSVPQGTFGSQITSDKDGNVFAAGNTTTPIDGQKQAGFQDCFYSMYDRYLSKQWTLQHGSQSQGVCQTQGIAVDEQGNTYLAGNVSGGMDNQRPINVNSSDAFISKFDSNQNLLWTVFPGKLTAGVLPDTVGALQSLTLDSASLPVVSVLSKNSAGVAQYLVLKLSSDGSLVWYYKNDNVSNQLVALTADKSGHVFVLNNSSQPNGSSSNTLQSYALTKLGSDGSKIFYYNTMPTSTAAAIAVDQQGGVYVVGQVPGPNAPPLAPNSSAFINKHDAVTGAILWTNTMPTLFGTDHSTWATVVTTDGYNSIFVSGNTDGTSIPWSTYSKSDRVYWTFDLTGTQKTTGQFYNSFCTVSGITATTYGLQYIIGTTPGHDMATLFLAKYAF